MSDSDVSSWIDARLTEMIDEIPWWCRYCGQGGNYEGARPPGHLLPPAGHECRLTNPGLRGIE